MVLSCGTSTVLSRAVGPSTNRSLAFLASSLSGSAAKIPCISLGPFVQPGAAESVEEKASVAQAVCQAAQEVGMFFVQDTGIDPSVTRRAREVTRAFFALPMEEKESVSIRHCPARMRGYQRIGDNVTQGKRDRHEGFDVYRDFPRQHAEDMETADVGTSLLRGVNQWPSEHAAPDMRLFFEDHYIPAMLQLGDATMRAMALGLGLSEYFFRAYYDRSFWVMRLLHYPPHLGRQVRAPQLYGCGEHTDYGCLTFVNQDPHVTGCLEARLITGEWVHVDPLGEGILAVNVGDMLERWTGGQFRATPHRVHQPDEDRVSVPFFFEPNCDAVIEPFGLSAAAPGGGVGSTRASMSSGHVRESVVYGEHLAKKVASNFSL